MYNNIQSKDKERTTNVQKYIELDIKDQKSNDVVVPFEELEIIEIKETEKEIISVIEVAEIVIVGSIETTGKFLYLIKTILDFSFELLILIFSGGAKALRQKRKRHKTIEEEESTHICNKKTININQNFNF